MSGDEVLSELIFVRGVGYQYGSRKAVERSSKKVISSAVADRSVKLFVFGLETSRKRLLYEPDRHGSCLF